MHSMGVSKNQGMPIWGSILVYLSLGSVDDLTIIRPGCEPCYMKHACAKYRGKSVVLMNPVFWKRAIGALVRLPGMMLERSL